MFKDDRLVLEIGADSYEGAQSGRESLVALLQRDPHNLTVWEEAPRPTGWWGYYTTKSVKTVVYNIVITADRSLQ
jgi:hypothetical protein